MIKSIDDIMFISDGNNPFGLGYIYGKGGLGYKPSEYNIIGLGIDKEGNPIFYKESTLQQKSDDELNNILVDNIEQLETSHYNQIGKEIEIPEDYKKNFIEENFFIKNILLNRKVKSIEKIDKSINKDIKSIDEEKENLDNEKGNIDTIREKMLDDIMDGKITTDEAIKVLHSYKSSDAEIFINRIDELIEKKQKVINELVSYKGKKKFDINDIYDLPLNRLKELKKSLSKEGKKLIKLEQKGIVEAPSIKQIEETKKYISELKEKKNELQNIPEEIKNKFSSVKNKFNREYFEDKRNVKLPNIKADEFEFKAVGIDLNTDRYDAINKPDIIQRKKVIYNLKDEFKGFYDDKYEMLRAVINTLDRETYNEIIKDKNAEVKVINTGQNYYNDKGELVYKADTNAPLDNVVIIKSNGKEYKYTIENKNYNSPPSKLTPDEKKLKKENREEFNKSFDFKTKIEYNDEIFLDYIQVEELENIDKNKDISNENKKILDKIEDLKLEGYESDDNEILNIKKSIKENIKEPTYEEIRYSFLKKVLPKTIDVKYTKGGLKPHKIQYNEKGISKENIYDYISKRAEATKFINFDKNGIIKNVVNKNDEKLEKETDLFKGSKLLHAINYPDYFIGTDYSNLIKTGKIDKNNILNTNHLTRDYYNPTLGDLSIGHYPEDYEIIKIEKEPVKEKKNKSLYKK